MAVCKFFLEGRCKFGERCKFEHPRNQDPRNQNTAGAFARPDNNQPRGAPRNQSPAAGNSNQSRSYPYHLHPETIKDDLTKERPLWIMSAYGPGRDAPVQLFGGFPLEQSPEEIRTLHYLAIASGNPQQSIQAEQELAATSNQQVQRVLNDLNGAIQYIQSGAKNHPNRLDFCAQNRFAAQFYTEQAAIHNAATSARQASFGQPAPFSQPQIAPPPPPQPAPQFGQGALSTTNSFGQQAQPLIQNAFNQPSQPNNAFGRSSVPSNGFAQPQQPQPNLFSNAGPQPNTFGAPAAQPFAPQPTPQTQPNPFGQNTSAAPNNAAFGQPQNPQQQFLTSTGVASSGGFASLDPSTYSTRDATGRLLTWKSRPVVYLETGEPCFQKEDGSLERIWFPDGPPTKFQTDDVGEVMYSGDEAARYRFLRENGTFQGGVMPQVPPKAEDVRWDL